jgi:hypothetical protein
LHHQFPKEGLKGGDLLTGGSQEEDEHRADVDPHGALVTGFLRLTGLDLPAGLTVEEGQGSDIYMKVQRLTVQTTQEIPLEQ